MLFADEPFAILGVNSDPPAEGKSRLAAEKILWRNWMDGAQDGPIGKQWRVRAWPRSWLIDARGVIRHRDLKGEDLEKAVRALLEEAR